MFMGSYSPRLDDKGRLILPAKFREELSDGLVLTRGQEHCLYAFPMREFERMYAQHKRHHLSETSSRLHACHCSPELTKRTPDKQGRITIAPPLRAYASLSRELAVNGVGSRLEIWDAATWDAYLAEQESVFASTAEEIIPGFF